MIDSGSSSTLIRKDVADIALKKAKRPIIYKRVTQTLISLTGNKLKVLGTVEFYVKNIGLIEFLVIDKMSHEILIGIDYLHEYGFTLDNEKLVWNKHVFHLLNNDNCRNTTGQVCEKNEMNECENKMSESDENETEWLTKLLHEYQDLFQCHSLPIADLPPFEINTIPGKVANKKPYRTPLAKRIVIEQELKKMLDAGVIQPSNSAFASPIHLVGKPDGSIRWTCDYRLLNDITVKDRYPLPLIQDIFDTLNGAAVFSTLDLRSGYWQIAMHPDSIKKTAFVCHAGQYEWNRMPFGVCNAPSFFVRAINSILAPLNKFCLAYMDDIIIFSKDEESHKIHLKQVFDVLRSKNITLKESKCHFNKQSLNLLGYLISKEGITAIPEKTQAIQNLPSPTSVTEIRSFLGMVSYYRQLIPYMAEIAEPLYYLTRKNVPWVWEQSQKVAFETLKNALTSSDVMAYPDTSKPYILMTDASDFAIGAILLQEDNEGNERPIQYLSQQLNPAQRKYATIEKEAFAVVTALKKFRPYLYDAEATIYTDHKPLLSLFKGEIANTKIQRWAVLLAEYGFPIKYCPGRKNVRADLLSRIRPQEIALIDADSEWVTPEQVRDHLPPTTPVVADDLCMDTLFMAQVAEYQDEREDARNNEESRFVIINNILYSIARPKYDAPQYPRLVLPAQFRDQVIARCHKDVGHQSLFKTMSRVQECYVWSGMKREIREWIQKCGLCQVHTKRPEKVPMGEMPIAQAPNLYIGIDLIGPLVSSKYSGAKYIMTTIDYHDGWAEGYPLANKTNETVWERLRNDFIPRYGAPEVIITDQGSEWKGADFQAWLKGLGIEHRRTTPYHPLSNGRIERFNGTLKNILKKLVNGSRADWEDQLGSALTSYRISTSTVTGQSPFMLKYAHPPRYPLTRLLDEDRSRNLSNRLEMHADLMQRAARATEESRHYNRERLKRQANAKEINEGDTVILKAREPLSLTAKWDFGFLVTKVNGKVLTILHPSTGVKQIVNRDQVRLADPDIAWDEVHPRPRRQQIRVHRKYGKRPDAAPRAATPPDAASPDSTPPATPPPIAAKTQPPLPRFRVKRRIDTDDLGDDEPGAARYNIRKRPRWTLEQIAALLRVQ
ncbi:MAG: DDE-type integrase/transposase/recombinase [Desulfobulbaceae bacterium]|nr:DDE-type integrase/transposase/recombinase [Desulfobulbaceae bacterium]